MKLLFCGDLAFTKSTGKDTILSDEMRAIFDSHDFRCVNFECAMKADKQKKVGPSIVLDETMCDVIKGAGFDLYCLANNHIMDEGFAGLQRVMQYLGPNTTGAGMNREEVYRPYILERDDVRIGIFNIAECQFGACTDQDPNAGGYAWFADPCIERTIRSLRETCDYVMIMAHAGKEEWDFPLPEIREMYKRYVDWGADIVIGNHPHRAQGWETYRGKQIYYCLGNFVFYKGRNVSNHRHAISVSIDITDDGMNCTPVWSCVNADGIVEVCREQTFMDRIYACNELLEDEERYMECVNRKALEAYDSIQEHYSQVTGIYTHRSLKNIGKTIVKRYIWHEKFNDLWLYHNLEIETNLWLARRAVRLKMCNDEYGK